MKEKLKRFKHANGTILLLCKCGSKDIQVQDCGYSSFNCGGAKCEACGHEVKSSTLGCFPNQEIADMWNADRRRMSEPSELTKLKADVARLRRALELIRQIAAATDGGPVIMEGRRRMIGDLAARALETRRFNPRLKTEKIYE